MESDNQPGLSLGVIWYDDDIIELECRVVYRGFSGVSTCYTIPENMIAFADSLDSLAQTADGHATFDAGLEDGSKRIALRAYTIDLAGHLAIHVAMATDGYDRRPEEVWRIELEMKTESWPMSKFAQQLRSVVDAREGVAFLPAIS